MLRTLYQLAQEERLIADTSFEMKPVAWTIVLNPDGTLAGDFISNKELASIEFTAAGKEKKRRELTKRLLVPRQFVIETGAGRTSGAYAYFLVDKADYVFGFTSGSPIKTPQTDKKLQARLELFINKVAECYTETKTASLEAMLTFLTRIKNEGLPVELPSTLTSNDQFAFKVLPDLDNYVHEDPAIIEYWKKRSNPPPSEGARINTCLVTGKPFTTEALFPGIKRVPGGTTSGAGLVSFNSKVFESYGWQNSENATVSPEASQAIATALNRLMDPAFETQDGIKLPRRFEVIAKDTVIAYWPKGFWIDPLDEKQGSFSNLLASSWKGLKPNEEDASPFHAFTLSGSQGRIIVRDYFETTAGELYRNLAFHMDSLETTPLTSPAKGKELPPLYGTNLLLQTSVLDGKTDNIPAPLAVQFHQAIHKGKTYKFPEPLINKALARSRAEIHDDSWKASYRADIRSALLKAYLIRNHNFITIKKAMNPKEKNHAYLFGRTLSCFGEMQRLANLPRTVNADLTTKHYSKFFARPFATYSALGASYNRHYKTALKNKAGAAAGLSKRLNNEFEAIQRSLGIAISKLSPPGMDSGFSTKEQALFTLGFHHQNLWNKQSSEDRIAWLKELELDPYDSKLIIAPLKQDNK
jgi:CRISPR-associated protein Csd1